MQFGVVSKTIRQLNRSIKVQYLRKSFQRPFSILYNYSSNMTNLEGEVQKARAHVKEQGDLVKRLKSEKALTVDIDLAVKELKARKRVLDQKELALDPPDNFDRAKCEDLLKRRFFYAPSFELYGGVAGLYDFGPLGCGMETNIMSIWRSHFVIQDQLLEVRCSQLTPHQVLKASGHTDRFTDVMVKDIKTNDCYRADHLLEGHLEKLMREKKCTAEKKEEYAGVLRQIDNMKKDELWENMQKYGVKAPDTNNELHDPQDFNLMFATSIGPSGLLAGFMRPETAQGIFLNFKRLLEYNNGRLPFGSAQVGCGFRNEIAPRAGLLRVREFLMAEIEYFVDPDVKEISGFKDVSDTKLVFLSRDFQMSGEAAVELTVGEAYNRGIISNTAVGYFLARIQMFLLKIGVDSKKMRFRQHMANEMAHYACDCWDGELKTSYGWTECVGLADRSCYDLQQHANATGVSLCAQVDLPEPISVSVVEVVLDKALVGKGFKKQAKIVMDYVGAMKPEEIDTFEKSITENGSHVLTIDGVEYSILKTMLKEVKRGTKELHTRDVVPHVIEPSFGIGRIMYSILEHNFEMREGDEKRTWLRLPALVAPVKCSVLPLSRNEAFQPFVSQISTALTQLQMVHKVDDSSGSIGRRYARTDEVGIPYGVTIDFDTVNNKPHTVTLRERDSTKQVRCSVDAVPHIIHSLITGSKTWQAVADELGLFEGQESI